MVILVLNPTILLYCYCFIVAFFILGIALKLLNYNIIWVGTLIRVYTEILQIGYTAMFEDPELINYERECFKRGYEEGYAKGVKQGHTEGRELGIQTGFLRYLPMGILQARVDHWEKEDRKEIAGLRALVATPLLTNDPNVVEDVDHRLKLAKNKCRQQAQSRNAPAPQVYNHKIAYQKPLNGTANIEDIY